MSLKNITELRLIVGEYFICSGIVQPFDQHLGEHITIIGGDRQIAWSHQWSGSQPRPLAVHLPAEDVADQHHHHAAVTVVRAEAAVL